MTRFSIDQNHSNFDRRRFNGPESSTPIPISKQTRSSTSNHIRSDGRSDPHQIRPIHIKTGVTSSANGSSYIEADQIKIICAVYGPKPRPASISSHSSPLIINYRFAPFSSSSHTHQILSSLESQAAQSLHQSISPALLPTSNEIFDLHLTVLQTDSPLSITHSTLAATLALAEAGIPTSGLVIAISAALSPSSQLLIDPTPDESIDSIGHLDFACIPASDSVTYVNFRSNNEWDHSQITLDQFDLSLDIARQSTHLIHPLAIKALQNHIIT